jgi:hypothetical protein
VRAMLKFANPPENSQSCVKYAEADDWHASCPTPLTDQNRDTDQAERSISLVG